MESFFWAPTGKKLPGKHGQQDLIAALKSPFQNDKPLKLFHISKWHGFRSNLL
jgi:hypothetical protein